MEKKGGRKLVRKFPAFRQCRKLGVRPSREKRNRGGGEAEPPMPAAVAPGQFHRLGREQGAASVKPQPCLELAQEVVNQFDALLRGAASQVDEQCVGENFALRV